MKHPAWAVLAAATLAALCAGCDDDTLGAARADVLDPGDLEPARPGEAGAPANSDRVSEALSGNGRPGRADVLRAYGMLRQAFGASAETEAPRYIFDPNELQAVANMGAGLPLAERWELMRAELARSYPGKIADELHWVFNSSGNLVCELALVYASPIEYVAFFGTPIGATGFSGRYNKSDVWDLMVDGEMWTYTPGQFDRTRYIGGDSAYLERGTGKGVAYVDHAWMIDYARGNILTMFPFGVIAPTLFVTLDYKSAHDQISEYGRLVLRGMFNP